MKTTALCLSTLVLAASCGDSGLCDSGELAAALAGAQAGDVVHAGSCRLEGSFDVPPGVTLEGSGILATRFFAPDDRAAINLLPGADVATFTDASVESNGVVGVLARGDGEAHVARVDIGISNGLAAGFEGLRALSMEDVTIRGTVTRANADALPPSGPPTGSAFGLVALNVANASYARVEVTGFTAYGWLIAGGASTLTNCFSFTTRGVNALFSGGTHTLDGFGVTEGIRGQRPFPAYGVVFADNAMITALLGVNDVDDVSVLIDHASGTFNVDVSQNNSFGVAMQSAHDVDLSGSFDDNGVAAIAAVDSERVRVHDANIDNTRLVTRLFEGMPLTMGDGVQFVRSSTGARIEGVTLSNNARVGALFELGGAALEASTFSNVTVTTTVGSSLGVVVQNGTRPANWDASITRNGTSSSTADLLAGPLGSVQGVGPCWMPPPDVQTMGVQAIIGY